MYSVFKKGFCQQKCLKVNSSQAKQQPLRGEIFKNFGKGGELHMGGLSILWGDLITP